MKPLPRTVQVTALSVLFGLALGAEVQCPAPSVSDTRPSLSSLQAQIDALTLRVNELENPTPKKVFVTSETFQGNFGGLDGADAICTQLAGAAGLSGTYRAWLGDTDEGPWERFTHATHPYALVDGTLIASSWEQLTDGTLLAPISVDEFGQQVPLVPIPSGTESGAVWTNVQTSGKSRSQFPEGNPDSSVDFHCYDWTRLDTTGNTGKSYATSSAWTGEVRFACESTLRLYCFEQ